MYYVILLHSIQAQSLRTPASIGIDYEEGYQLLTQIVEITSIQEQF